jgi:hypothetical protein
MMHARVLAAEADETPATERTADAPSATAAMSAVFFIRSPYILSNHSKPQKGQKSCLTCGEI